jgi:hypothetical protein
MAVKQARTAQIDLAENGAEDDGARALMQSLFATNWARRLLFEVLDSLTAAITINRSSYKQC